MLKINLFCIKHRQSINWHSLQTAKPCLSEVPSPSLLLLHLHLHFLHLTSTRLKLGTIKKIKRKKTQKKVLGSNVSSTVSRVVFCQIQVIPANIHKSTFCWFYHLMHRSCLHWSIHYNVWIIRFKYSAVRFPSRTKCPICERMMLFGDNSITNSHNLHFDEICREKKNAFNWQLLLTNLWAVWIEYGFIVDDGDS